MPNRALAEFLCVLVAGDLAGPLRRTMLRPCCEL